MKRAWILTSLLLLCLALACTVENFAEGKQAFQAGNYERAYAILAPHAEAGHAEAQNYLGTMLNQGDGVPQDLDAARGWFEKSAQQDYPKAFYNLGVIYAEARGVEADFVEAYKWFMLAEESGLSAAADGLEYCRQNLQPHQIAEAERRVSDWGR